MTVEFDDGEKDGGSLYVIWWWEEESIGSKWVISLQEGDNDDSGSRSSMKVMEVVADETDGGDGLVGRVEGDGVYNFGFSKFG